jgi:hypothetical protein
VLDIQIYNNILNILQETNMNITYSEIVYLLYREHFPAHPLLYKLCEVEPTQWTNSLLQIIKSFFQSWKMTSSQSILPSLFPKRTEEKVGQRSWLTLVKLKTNLKNSLKNSFVRPISNLLAKLCKNQLSPSVLTWKIC